VSVRGNVILGVSALVSPGTRKPATTKWQFQVGLAHGVSELCSKIRVLCTLHRWTENLPSLRCSQRNTFFLINLQAL